MNIQLIKFEKDKAKDTAKDMTKALEGITVSTINSPRSLDEFDVNVIDLSAEAIWRHRGQTNSTIDCINDFQTICEMVKRCSVAKILYVLPTNVNFRYCGFLNNGKYEFMQNCQLKDCSDKMHDILSKCIPMNIAKIELVYENTTTVVNKIEFQAGFYFETTVFLQVTKSEKSNKTTTVKLNDRIFATTLQIPHTMDALTAFINAIFFEKEGSPVPEWINDISFGNDDEQHDLIMQNNQIIEEAKSKIEEASKQLQKNMEYKSILYQNGNELVEEVFEMLECMLNCDLSSFVDEKREDFLIKKEGCTFIGEIKGVTSNVKNEHISQVEVHYQSYIDKLEESGEQENVKQLLIINPQRTKPIQEREPVHENQIKLAVRNECLMIETNTFMRLFEQFIQGTLSSQQCIEVFSTKTGLLKLSDFGLSDC